MSLPEWWKLAALGIFIAGVIFQAGSFWMGTKAADKYQAAALKQLTEAQQRASSQLKTAIDSLNMTVANLQGWLNDMNDRLKKLEICHNKRHPEDM